MSFAEDDPVCFYITEKEQLIFNNGEPKRCAKLVLAVLRYGPRCRIKVMNVKGVVTDILPQIAVNLVRTALDAGVDDSTRRVPEFGTVRTGLHFELSQGVRWRPHDKAGTVQEVHYVVVVVHAVQNEVVLLGTLPVRVKVALASTA